MENIIVIKFGGSLFVDQNNRNQFWLDVKYLHVNGYKIIIVHGGGKEVSFWLDKYGCQTKFINGLRYTDDKSIEVVEMVLSGKVNKTLASELSFHDVLNVGISGRDSNLLIAEKSETLGLVGENLKVNNRIILELLKSNIIPIISPISSSENGETLNVNADDSAMAIAISVKADKLIYMTDTKGVMLEINDENSLINVLNKEKADELIQSKVITGGMIPKINSAFFAILSGVKEINIVDGREFSIIREMFQDNKAIGTKIVN